MNQHNEREGPLDRFQDVSRNHNNQKENAPSLHTTSTNSSATDSILDFAETKCTESKHIDVVNEHEEIQNPAQSQNPEIYRATSYGVAAPYATPEFPAFHIHEALSRTTSHRPRSVLSEKTLECTDGGLAPASRVSTDANGFTYPEGGLQAWLCVLGSFCGMMGAMGVMNTLGVIQTYIAENQLAGMSESTIGWIFSLYTFLAFFCGIQIGPLSDALGPRWLVLTGSVLVLITWFLLGLCTQYWQFIVVFGLCGGLGTSLVFTPAITAVGHWFFRRRALCTGIAAVGGSLGGVVCPLVLQDLFPKVGFAWATRVIGFMTLVLFIFANLLIRARLPRKEITRDSIMPDFKIFRDPVLVLTTAGIFFVEWALFIPLTYLTSYSLAHGVDRDLSYQIIAFFNVGSCFGRWLPGFVADKAGRFNTMIATLVLCIVTTFAIWLPARGSVAAIIAYAVIFGFGSGSGISLTPVCVSQLCKVENYGRYYATCYTIVSFACLTGLPLAGSLITACGGQYYGVIVFTGVSYCAALVAFTFARGFGVGWALNSIY